MGKHNVVSGILVMIVILTIAASTFMVVSYATGVLTTAVAFASSDQIAKIQACGITLPTEFYKLRADIPGLVLPGIYVGWPSLMVILSILMFIAGYYYGNENEDKSSSETTTTTTRPNERGEGGKYESSTKTKTQKTSKNDGN